MNDDRVEQQLSERAPAAPTEPVLGPVATGLILVAALYFGRDVLMPLALAVLVAFAVTPIVQWLRRMWLPRLVAIGTTIVLLLILIVGLTAVVGTQLVNLADNFPTYRYNITAKITAARELAPSGSVISRFVASLRALRRDLTPEPEADPDPETGPTTEAQKPIPVVVQSPPVQPLDILRTIVQPIMGPIVTIGLVIIFVIFILIERAQLRDRFIKLVGGDDLQRSTQLITEAAQRVSRYLLAQLAINISYGIPIGFGLWLIGVPNAPLWGVFAVVLRFIPYLGPWIAALFPIVIAFGSEPGWSMLLWTVALFLFMELISNNIVEPWIYGASTGLSSFAVILAAIFWTSLWGPVGLLLSTPLTVCLVVLGKYIPRLVFLDIALGSDPVLTPAESFYQRLLTGNVEEAVDLADKYIDEGKAHVFYEEVVIAALRLAANDRERSSDLAARKQVAAGVRAVLDDVVARLREADPESHAVREAGVPEAETAAGSRTVLCMAGRTDLDWAAALVLAHRLESLGVRARVVGPIPAGQHGPSRDPLETVSAVALCHLGTHPHAYVRYWCRRIKREMPDALVIVCPWNLADVASSAADVARGCGDDVAVAESLAAAEGHALSTAGTVREPA